MRAKAVIFWLQPDWAKPPSTPSADGVKPTKKPVPTATQRPKPKPKPTPPKVTTHRPTKPPKKTTTTEEPTTESSAVEEVQSTSEKPKPSKPIVKPPLQPEVTDGCPCENENEVETTTAKKPTTSRRPATTTGPTTTTSQGEEVEVVPEEGDLDTASSQDVDCSSDGFKSHQMCNKVSGRRGNRKKIILLGCYLRVFPFSSTFFSHQDGTMALDLKRLRINL